MQKSYVWSSVGSILLLIGAAMLLPVACGLYFQETEYLVFLGCAGVTVLVGFLLCFGLRPYNNIGKRGRLHKGTRVMMKDGYAIVTYGWIGAALFAMLPYLFTGTVHGVTDGLFEAVSGFTMTGATTLYEIEAVPRCVLLWRSLTQWFGGMGVLVLFVALLNGQNHGSLQLIRADGLNAARQRLNLKMLETASGLALIYVSHTVLLMLLYRLAGMGLFDAVNHGFTVISAGGFSTKTAGIAAYQSATIEWITIFGMFLTGLNYTLFLHAWHNKSLSELKNSLELRVYLGLIFFASIAVIALNAPEYHGTISTLMRHGLFQVLSIITTAGFVVCDFEQWVVPAQLILILLMLCGACAGAVGGGIKIDRHIILIQKSIQEIRRFLHPNLVTRLKSNHQLLEDGVILSVNMFFYIYIALIVFGTAVVSMCGVELLGALTAVLSCLGGIGPAFGQAALYYGAMPLVAKWALIVLMLIGRLEVYAVMVLIHPLHRQMRESDRIQVLKNLERDGVMEPLVRDDDDDEA